MSAIKELCEYLHGRIRVEADTSPGRDLGVWLRIFRYPHKGPHPSYAAHRAVATIMPRAQLERELEAFGVANIGEQIAHGI